MHIIYAHDLSREASAHLHISKCTIIILVSSVPKQKKDRKKEAQKPLIIVKIKEQTKPTEYFTILHGSTTLGDEG